MTREEFQTISTEVLADLSDSGKVSEKLSKLRDGFNEEVSKAETSAKSVEELTKANESLQKANMELFLKTGVYQEPKKESEKDKESEPDFDSLFDEKGELK